MTIQTFSPLQNDGNYYLNVDDFDSRLMWTDTGTTLNYVVCRLEDTTWKIIANGKLTGYNDGTANLQYKFNFNNYIKINQNREPSLYKEDIGLFSFTSVSASELSLITATGNIIESNIAKITTKNNGEVVLSGIYTPSDLTGATNTVVKNYVFHDSINSYSQLPSSPYFYVNSWIPITVPKSETVYITTKSYGDIIIDSYTLTSTKNSKTFLFYIPTYCTKIQIAGLNGNVDINEIIPLHPECKNQLFYYSINGNLDMMYIEGNTHEVNNVTKKLIKIGNQQLPTSVNINKQLKANTGFRLNQEQMYSLIKTPYVFNKLSVPTVWDYTRNLFEITYVPIVYGAGTGTITRIDDYNFKFNCTSTTNVKMRTSNIITRTGKWTASFEIKVTGAGSGYIPIIVDFNGEGDLSSGLFGDEDYRLLQFGGTVNSTSGSKSFNINFDVVGEYSIKNIKVSYSTDISDYTFPWSGDTLVPTSPSIKRYLLDTTTFEGYVGSKYSEKNVELLLTDEKTHKRKTNFDLTFWD